MSLSVSVIIPTYNRVAALEKCLQSLTVQHYPQDKYEIIVVDDGSTDSISELMGAIKFPVSIKFIQQSNQGSGAARNAGAHCATGDVLLFFDDDVIATPYLLNAHIQTHQEYDPSVVIGYTPFAPDLPHTPVYEFHRQNWDRIFTEIERAASFQRLLYYHFITLNLSVRRQNFERIGSFNTIFNADLEDSELGLRFMQNGIPFRFNKTALAFHLPSLGIDSITTRQKKNGYRAGAYYLAHSDDQDMAKPLRRDYVLCQSTPYDSAIGRMKKAIRKSRAYDILLMAFVRGLPFFEKLIPASLLFFGFSLVKLHYYSSGFRMALAKANYKYDEEKVANRI